MPALLHHSLLVEQMLQNDRFRARPLETVLGRPFIDIVGDTRQFSCSIYNVLNVIMLENTPLIVLTELIRNLEACVFALMQTALPIEAEEFGLPKERKN